MIIIIVIMVTIITIIVIVICIYENLNSFFFLCLFYITGSFEKFVTRFKRSLNTIYLFFIIN